MSTEHRGRRHICAQHGRARRTALQQACFWRRRLGAFGRSAIAPKLVLCYSAVELVCVAVGGACRLLPFADFVDFVLPGLSTSSHEVPRASQFWGRLITHETPSWTMILPARGAGRDRARPLARPRADANARPWAQTEPWPGPSWASARAGPGAQGPNPAPAPGSRLGLFKTFF